MSDTTATVHCPTHGDSYATFVCKHLAHGSGLGFCHAAAHGDLRPNAWCYDCDLRLLAAGEWNAENESAAGVTMLCAGCYDEVRQRNSVRRPSIEVDGFAVGGRPDVLAVTPKLEFPPESMVREQPLGAQIKALFLLRGRDGSGQFLQGERMWAEILCKTAEGVLGVLKSRPVTEGTLRADQLVFVRYEEVIAVQPQGEPTEGQRDQEVTILRRPHVRGE